MTKDLITSFSMFPRTLNCNWKRTKTRGLLCTKRWNICIGNTKERGNEEGLNKHKCFQWIVRANCLYSELWKRVGRSVDYCWPFGIRWRRPPTFCASIKFWPILRRFYTKQKAREAGLRRADIARRIRAELIRWSNVVIKSGRDEYYSVIGRWHRWDEGGWMG